MTIKIKPGVPAPGMRDRMGPTFDERRGVEYRQLRAASLVNRLNARPMPVGAIGAPSGVSVPFSIPTLDQALGRRLEPRAPRPDLRFEAMTALAAGGIPTRLFIMPVLPRLTDGEANLRALLVRAREAGAEIAESNVLFLRRGTRETFFEFLRAEFPELVPEYERLYADSAYARRDYVAAIEALVRRLSAEVGFAARRRADRPADSPTPSQLSLVW